jgi:transposase
MISFSDLKNHHISILYFWNKGVRSAPAIHRETNISLRTIYYNINKWKQTNSRKQRGENGQPRILSEIEKQAIGQYIRRNNEIILKEIKENFFRAHHNTVST